MKVLAQLLKEFWLPLLLGGTWTLYNLIETRAAVAWTVRDGVNIFGPSFFFISWLVAQWYRVRKQQRVDEGLSEIRADLRAMRSPLLPCGLFYTLKFTSGDVHLGRLFSHCEGWKKYGKPSDILRPVGLVKLNSAYNAINMAVHESRCSLDAPEIERLGSTNDSVFVLPVEVSIEFFFGKRKRPTGAPSLVLATSAKTAAVTKVIGVELFDKTVFQDVVCRRLSIRNAVDHDWSTTDLRGAYMRVTLEFLHLMFQGKVIGDVGWPSLHNLQLVIGPNLTHILSFDLNQLSKQVVRRNPHPLMKGDIESIQVSFECDIDDDVYRQNLFVTAEAAVAESV